jgi:hypothetical protein
LEEGLWQDGRVGPIPTRLPLIVLGAALILPGCREAAEGLASGPGGNEAALVLVGALADRFGPIEREPAFDALRPKLARAALVPSRVFDDTSAWPVRGEDWRTVDFEGFTAGGTYRLGVRGQARAPAKAGDYRAHLRLTRAGDGRFEWSMREELALGPVRPSDLANALTRLMEGGESLDGPAARSAACDALPRTTAALGRLLRVEALDLARDAAGATAVRLAVRIDPEGLRPYAPRYAAFVARYATPMRLAATAIDADGTPWWTLDAADNLWTLRIRTRGGSLVPLQGPADRRLPDALRVVADYSTKMGLFRVGVRRLAADVGLTRTAREKGFRARYDEAPDWQLPFLVKPFLRASLVYPFEPPGSEVGWAVESGPAGETLLVGGYRARVRESWIVRWLGGLTGTAVSEFRRGAEAEADRFNRECLQALRADLSRLGAPRAVP